MSLPEKIIIGQGMTYLRVTSEAGDVIIQTPAVSYP